MTKLDAVPASWALRISDFAPPNQSANRKGDQESDFVRTARKIIELARQLDEIQKQRRVGHLAGWELVEQCLRVWFEIRALDKSLNSPNERG